MKWIDLKEFDFNKYSSNSSKICVLEADLEFPKGLQKLHKYYPLGAQKIETKREMLSNYQLKIFIIFILLMLYNYCLTFLIKKNMCFIMKTLLETKIKTKQNTFCIRI